MKKICGWIKRNWLVYLSSFIFFIVISLVVFIFTLDSAVIRLGEKIQASAVILLVLITGVYAFQTYQIVKAERNKRTADYNVKRIDQFYKPFLDRLWDLGYESYVKDDRTGAIWAVFKETKDLLWLRGYMVSKETHKKITDIEPLFTWAKIAPESKAKLMEKFRSRQREICDVLEKEKNDIEQYLRHFYKIES